MEFIEAIETSMGVVAQKNFLPMQAGDVAETFADIKLLYEHVGYTPKTKTAEGVSNFIEWYIKYYERL
jgi:UDP-glucuronate 4-epimerase